MPVGAEPLHRLGEPAVHGGAGGEAEERLRLRGVEAAARLTDERVIVYSELDKLATPATERALLTARIRALSPGGFVVLSVEEAERLVGKTRSGMGFGAEDRVQAIEDLRAAMKKRIEAWAVVDVRGYVALSTDEKYARTDAKNWNEDLPHDAPHRVVHLVEADSAREAVVRAAVRLHKEMNRPTPKGAQVTLSGTISAAAEVSHAVSRLKGKK